MKTHTKILTLLTALGLPSGMLQAEDHDHGHDHSGDAEESFEHHTEFHPITGEGANIAGIISPEVFVFATGGLTADGVDPADLATSEHDPQNDFGFQIIELHLDVELSDKITGGVYAIGSQGEDEWEANLEEAYLHYQLNDWLSVGGGQFFNRFGFQAEKHVHEWDFVNQNLVNSRMLNEGELVTQGGEVLITPKEGSILTIGAGGVRTHGHGHEEEEDGHGAEDPGHADGGEEEHHLEADDAGFNNWVASADWRQQLPFSEATTLSTSIATGENGFGRDTWIYGIGLEKIWGAHDHGDRAEFCRGAVRLRTEFIGRNLGVQDEDGDSFDADDYGFSTGLFYGLTDSTTLSFRHDWVSELEDLELDDRHRFSPALSTFLDQDQRIQARLQYDFTTGDTVGDEHAAWLQISLRWGGRAGAHRH